MQTSIRSPRWYLSGWAVTAAAFVLPLVGLILLWMRPRPRVWLKLVATLGIAVIGVLHLVLFCGLRIELDGSGMRPIFSWKTAAADADRLEQHRAAQPAAQPAASPAPAAPAASPVDQPGSAAPLAGAPPAVAFAPSGSTYWTDFRGPARDGRYDEQPVLATWPAAGLTPLWKQPIGGGYASFAVAEGRAFTIEQRRASEAVVAYDLRTGRELWTSSWPGFFRETMGGDGPRATPTWHAGRVYALGAEGELRCLEAATGALVWRTNILAEHKAPNVTWAMSASPLAVDGKIIVQPGGAGASVVAYDAGSGKPVWQSQHDRQAYTSPMAVTISGERQLLVVSGVRVMGMTIADGRVLWEFPWTTQFDANVAQPVVLDGDRVFVSAGYDHGAVMLAVTRDGATWHARELWQNKAMKNRFASSVVYGDSIFGFDEGILACVDAKTGERRWKGGRYGYGQLLLAGGNLIILAEDGGLALVRATPDRFDEISHSAAIEGKTWNVPSMSDGILLVRNAREMAAFRVAR